MQMSIPHKLNRAASLAAAALLATVACGEALFSPKTSMMALLMNCKTEEEREQLRQQRDAMPPRKAFYGRVVDTGGNPVPDAAVAVHWNTLSLRKGFSDETYRDSLKTDKNGCFKKKCSNAARFFADVSKEGYEGVYGGGSKDFINHPLHSEENPVTFVMRKRGPLTFLIISPFAGQWTEDVFRIKGTNSVSHPLDLLAWQSSRQWKDSTPANADLWIDADFDAMGQRWNITYSITNGPGGIVLSDEMLYEAPAEGYAPSVSVAFTNGYKQRKYLYVRSRTPSVYSRIMFVHGVSVGEGGVYLNVACTAWVNPYGDRSLEFDGQSDSVFSLADSLRDEALEALAAGKYPKRPDMPERIKAAEEQNKKRREESRRLVEESIRLNSK